MLSRVSLLTHILTNGLGFPHNANITMAFQVRDVAENEFQPSSSSRILDPPGGPSREQAGRRRKVPDSVTLNACTTCKKARTKVATKTPLPQDLSDLFSFLVQYTESC